MDSSTLSAYDASPAEYAAEWEDQPSPTDLQAIVREFFRPGPTADIGCGSGRDAAWLASEGFPTIGYDPSAGLLAEARRRHPEISFYQSALPELDGIADDSLTNVLCETVIMHLPASAISASVHRLVGILAPGGTLYLSWRVTEGNDRRDDQGRLYTAFSCSLARDAMSGTTILHDEQAHSVSSEKTIHRLVARRDAR
jgi:SAM-dependent methyltransferase